MPAKHRQVISDLHRRWTRRNLRVYWFYESFIDFNLIKFKYQRVKIMFSPLSRSTKISEWGRQYLFDINFLLKWFMRLERLYLYQMKYEVQLFPFFPMHKFYWMFNNNIFKMQNKALSRKLWIRKRRMEMKNWRHEVEDLFDVEWYLSSFIGGSCWNVCESWNMMLIQFKWWQITLKRKLSTEPTVTLQALTVEIDSNWKGKILIRFWLKSLESHRNPITFNQKVFNQNLIIILPFHFE
jgi:hypothetical protein